MSDIGQINSLGPAFPVTGDSPRRAAEHPPAAIRSEAAASSRDRVELSDRALLLSRLRELPDIREELVERVKASIDAGTYETDDKLDRAVEALANELDQIG